MDQISEKISIWNKGSDNLRSLDLKPYLDWIHYFELVLIVKNNTINFSKN